MRWFIVDVLFVVLLVGCGAATHPAASAETPRPCMADADCRGADRICHEQRCQFADEVRAARAIARPQELEPSPAQTTTAVVGTATNVAPTTTHSIPAAVAATSAPTFDMFMGDVRHTGRSPYPAPSAMPSIAFSLTIGGRIYGSPVINTNGLIAVGSTDQSVVGVRDTGTGQVVFRYVGTGRFNNAGVAMPDGAFVFGASDGVLVSLGELGQIRWQRRLGTAPLDAPLSTTGDTIWASGNAVVAITATGVARSSWPFEGARTAVSQLQDGSVCAASLDGTLRCFASNGSQRFSVALGASTDSAPAVGDDGTIYIGDDGGNMTAIGPDGSIRFRVHTGAAVRTTPALGRDGSIYFGSDDRTFYGVSSTGEVRFRLQTGGRIRSSARIDSEERILFGSQDDFLYALNAAGEVVYRVNLGANIDSSPSIGPNRTIYAGTDAGTLVALR